MPVIVSDTSPVRALDFLGQIELLSSLFDVVFVPPAVRDELLQPRVRFRPFDIAQISNAVLRSPSDLARVQQLLQRFQRGESEAIALAEELDADLLIDEMDGRREATRLGLRVTGVIGMLVEARRRLFIPAVVPLLERLRSELGFYLSSKLIEDVRREVQE